MPWPTKKSEKAWRDNRYRSWLKLYRKEFNSLRQFRTFVQKVFDDNTNRTNLVLNTGERLISFADHSDRLAKARPAFQIFFLVVCAEAIIRIIRGSPHHRGISESSVQTFFNTNLSAKDKQMLETRFSRSLADTRSRQRGTSLRIDEIIQYFYRIRCEVAHAGVYWNFHWANDDADMMNFIEYEDGQDLQRDVIEVKARTTYETIRPAFIRAVIHSAESIL